MARLNEPPGGAPGPSTDTVDAVKRRFLRQNRELAKTNSQQSIRIRNLETEGSRLLAENLSLREQVLQLQNALETQSNRPSFENIDAVKSQLEAKLLEFGSLVAELGQMQKVDAGPRCKSQTAATRRSPDERQWRSGLGLQEVENAMLPTIVEDKYFPRRTMGYASGADELREILEDPDSQSPDIGPPPISRFEHEDPITFDPSPPEEEQLEDPEDPEPALSINLETRRKRRESGPRLDIRRTSVFDSPPDDTEERSSKGVRAGAKRKFSVQEDEDKSALQTESFRYTRRNTPSPAEEAASSKDDRPTSPERPVLGSKPVNIDPVLSPKKQRSSAKDNPDKKPAPNLKSNRGRLTITRTTQPELLPLQLPKPIPTTEIHLESLPPKTPAVEDIFSPPPTEPSTSRPESKDTPPPGDLSSSDHTGLGARPSRRARPQVSYKEPSLNAKMRRPGKELVDAVIPQNDRSTSVEPTPMTSVKREPLESSSSWKSLPPVSSRGAEEEAGIGSPLREKLDRREGTQGAESVPDQPKLNSSAASNAISALISATSTSKRKVAVSAAPLLNDSSTTGTSETATQAQQVSTNSNTSTGSEIPGPVKQEEKDNLAIFDFTDCSPNDAQIRPRVDLTKTAKSSRRHSSIPASSVIEQGKPESRPRTDGSLSSSHSRTGSGSGVKSTSAPNLARSTSAAKEKRTSALPSGSSHIDLKTAVAKAGMTNLRAERAASRRKSMML